MICPSCGAENKEAAKFCHECGSPLVGCSRCGAAHGVGEKFCQDCGTPLVVPSSGAARAADPVTVVSSIPELRLVSVLFVDLVGFTALSESRDVEDVRDLLGRYFEVARTIVGRHGGVIEKFIGDAVMAVWGAPVAREDDAERSVRAALEIVDAITAFAEEVGAPGLRARAGVVTGQVAALENPGEGLVVGDRVNTASRVQSAAAAGSVLVDEVTRQVTSAAIVFEDAGEHAAKGKAKPLRLWRAVRVVAGVGGADREQGLAVPLVGRDADLRLLKDLLHAGVNRGVARLVAVSGAAGIGKSRLRQEFSNYVDGLAETLLWHEGRCLSYGDGVAYWALVEMVRQRLGIAEDAGAEEAAAKLVVGLERWVPDAGDREFLTPRLGALLGVSEPGLGREELFAGWRLFFERLAAQQPVILVFEDLQWADQGLLDFIEHVLDWSARSPIFMLTLARPELAQRREGWPAGRRGVTLIDLEPLEDAAIGVLLDTLVGQLPARGRDRIVAHAQGVPLYAIETVRALSDRGVLAERDGRLVPRGELGELDVPASLSSLLASRLDALEPPERELVKVMAVFGGAFPRSAAAALGDLSEDELDGILSGLVRKQVLTIRADPLSPERGQYAFAQGLLRTVAYETMSRRERKPRHQAAAEHLRHAFPNDGEEVAELIAAHYLDAYHAAQDDLDSESLRAETITALRRAAQRAATVGAPEAAERSYRTAVGLAKDPTEQIELTRAAGEMALQAGRWEAVLELLETASAGFREAGRERDAARLADQTGLALYRLGRVGEAIERITGALEVLGADQLDADVAGLSCRLGWSLMIAGHLERAASSLEVALRVAQALELPAVLCDALSYKAALYQAENRPEEARVLFDGAIAIAERHELITQLVRAHGNNGNLQMCMDMPGALQQVEAALGSAVRLGDRDSESWTTCNLMYLHLLTGRWQEVERLASELLDELGDSRPGAEFLHLRLAVLWTLRGELDSARDSVAQLDAFQRSEDTETRAMRDTVIVRVLMAEGHFEQALGHGKRVLAEVVETLGVANETVRDAWPDTLEAALAVGHLESARGLLALLAAQPPGHIPPYLRAQLARGSALTAAASEDHNAVEAGLTAAIDGFRALSYPYWLARAQTDLAVWLIDQHRNREADPLLSEATTTLRLLGATPALARARNLVSQRGSENATPDSSVSAAIDAPAEAVAKSMSSI